MFIRLLLGINGFFSAIRAIAIVIPMALFVMLVALNGGVATSLLFVAGVAIYVLRVWLISSTWKASGFKPGRMHGFEIAMDPNTGKFAMGARVFDKSEVVGTYWRRRDHWQGWGILVGSTLEVTFKDGEIRKAGFYWDPAGANGWEALLYC